MPEHFLGIDVGYRATGRSTGLCLLTVDQRCMEWRLTNTGTSESRRIEDLRMLVPAGTNLTAVGIDGPIASGLRWVPHYRSAEALLSRGPFQGRGKPGQTSSPVGQNLHCHATQLAKLVLLLQEEGHFSLASATHTDAIHDKRIVEAFPTAFLGILLTDAHFENLGDVGRGKSDTFWELAVRHGPMGALVQNLVSQVDLAEPLQSIRNHDHRAALTCALTALCVARNRYVAVGDPEDGDIILPPAEVWGKGEDRVPWAEAALSRNLETVRRDWSIPNHHRARLLRNGERWRPENEDQ